MGWCIVHISSLKGSYVRQHACQIYIPCMSLDLTTLTFRIVLLDNDDLMHCLYSPSCDNLFYNDDSSSFNLHH